MRYLNTLFLLLVIVGGVNWLLVGISAIALLPVLARWTMASDATAR